MNFTLGHYRGCAARADGRVVCWGLVLAGENPPTLTKEPQLVDGITDAVEVGGGGDLQFCARRKTGEVACFGLDLKAKDQKLSDVVELGSRCARHANGKVSCMEGEDSAWKVVDGIDDAASISHGSSNECVIRKTGDVLCWGSNTYGQLMNGKTDESDKPVVLEEVKGATEIGTGYFSNDCVLAGSDVKCWAGETLRAKTPAKIKGLKDVEHIAIGEYHSCALMKGGKVACWGSNSSGQLGSPSDKQPPEGTAIVAEGISDVVELRVAGGEPAGGAGTTCVRLKNDEFWCWGAMVESEKPVKVDLSVK